MTTIIQCSGCQRRLKVPEGVLGKMVKCPACGAQFTAVAEESAGPPPLPPDDAGIQSEAPPPTAAKSSLPPPSRAERAPLDDEAEAPRRRRRRREDEDDEEDVASRGRRGHDEEDDFDDQDDRPRRRRSVLKKPVTGSTLPPAICLMVTGVLGILGNGFQAVIAIINPDFLVQNNPLGPAAAAPPVVSVAAGLLLALFALVTCLGSVAMIKLRWYGLAMAGAILAMINVGQCCCILGLPFGIWAIVVLSRPEVKDAFS